MWVIGLLEGEEIWSCDLNVRQYVCSGVRLDGPGGSFTACKGSTGAAILAASVCPGRRPMIDCHMVEKIEMEKCERRR